MKKKLNENEKIVKEGKANLQKGIETIGGKLFLTDERIIFESHIINIQKGEVEFFLRDIISSEKGWTKFLGIIPLFPNAIIIKVKNLKEYRFTLFGGASWITEINKNKNT